MGIRRTRRRSTEEDGTDDPDGGNRDSADDEARSLGDTAESVGQNDGERPNRLVLASMSEYRPGMTFRVVGRLPAPITIRLLRRPDGETVPVLERPDEYVGYVARSQLRDDQADSVVTVFTRDQLAPDVRYDFLSDAQVFSERLRLFRASVRETGADGGEESESEQD